MKLIWATDIHLNFLDAKFPYEFGKQLSSQGDALVLTGDIAEHLTLQYCLIDLANGFENAVYFTNGNHDLYYGGFVRTRRLAEKLHETVPFLHYLPKQPVVLNDNTVLIGSDGWYDCRCGDPYRLEMTDFNLIDEFKFCHKDEIIRLSRVEADTLALQADIQIREAAKQHKNIYFATHVPPFPDPERKDGVWDPWFVHVSMGNKLADIAADFPEISFTILAGHRHKPYTYRVSNNMIMLVGAAEYRNPAIAKVFTI